jgi:hypothetical protein
MNIKKSLITLAIVHVGMVSAQDKSGVVEKLVVAPIAAVALMGIEAVYRLCTAANNVNYDGSKAIYPAGPIFTTAQAERLARNNYDNRYFFRPEDQKILETAIYHHPTTDRFTVEAFCNLQFVHTEKEVFMNEQLPQVFKKYAFYRNLALIWGGMHIYDTYQSTKNEKYR